MQEEAFRGPAAREPGAHISQLARDVQQILDIFVDKGYALKVKPSREKQTLPPRAAGPQLVALVLRAEPNELWCRLLLPTWWGHAQRAAASTTGLTPRKAPSRSSSTALPTCGVSALAPAFHGLPHNHASVAHNNVVGEGGWL